MKVTVLTSSAGCPKCEKAETLLAELQETYDFDLQVVDIMKQPKVAREHELGVTPGVVIDEELAVQGSPDRATLEAALERERK